MTIYKHLSYLQKARFLSRQIQTHPPAGLGMVVVIPCYCEPDLRPVLTSLAQCSPPRSPVEVILVFNASEQERDEVPALHAPVIQQVKQWSLHHPTFFHVHLIVAHALPRKHAGVGLARKIGLDEAVDRFEQVEQTDGILVCLDADCTVSPNYFTAIEAHFRQFVRCEAVSIWYEHPLNGDAYPPEAYTAVVHFELSLRYYIQALRYCGYPYAVHAIGSAIACTTNAYQKYGGMNRRQGAEDFHFLHKFTPQRQVHELHSTAVFPSPRPSSRAPLGTGQAVRHWLAQESPRFSTYQFAIFQMVQAWLAQVDQYFEGEVPALPPVLDQFLVREGFYQALGDMCKHATQLDSFRKRFFAWLDPLKMKRCVHFIRDHGYPNEALLKVCSELWTHLALPAPTDSNAEEWLSVFRKLEKGTIEAS